jgi:broad specificity phosphatase PhoE
MSSLHIVRHAQASLFADDYDQLSEHGFRQSSLLGEYFNDQKLQFDQVFIGPRLRHRQTAETAMPKLKSDPTAVVQIDELDEHQVDRLVARHSRELGELFPRVAEYHAAFRAAESDQDRRRTFAILFEEVANLWVNGECPLFGVESWVDFCARVNDGIDRMIAMTGRGKKAIAFTSAGTVAATLHRALRCPDAVALGLGWRVWNCSLTEYAFSENRFSLDQFNAVPHMSDRADWTYR